MISSDVINSILLGFGIANLFGYYIWSLLLVVDDKIDDKSILSWFIFKLLILASILVTIVCLNIFRFLN
jgi:hypothetical protein